MNTNVVFVEGSRCRVTVVAIMPGPQTGMTLMTQRIVDDMRKRMDVRLFDIGKRHHRSSLIWTGMKAWSSLLSGLRILLWKPAPGECLYIPINSQAGLLYNVWQFLFGRMCGFQIIAHHHGWSYLYEYDRKMDWLIRLAGKDGIHVVACPEMLHDLRKVYPRSFGSAFVTPGIVGPKSHLAGTSRQRFQPGQRRFRIGMLSNLVITKGVGEAIDTLESCLQRGLDVELYFAGPVRDEQSQRRIDAAIAIHGDRLVHLGPIYNQAKDDFYRSLDAFIFPTRYRNESWGIVLNEALMAGVPVVTYRRGCTGYLVQDAGLVVGANECFAERAADQFQTWLDNPEIYCRACELAATRGIELRDEAEHQLDCFLKAFETKQWPRVPDFNSETCCCESTAGIVSLGASSKA